MAELAALAQKESDDAVALKLSDLRQLPTHFRELGLFTDGSLDKPIWSLFRYNVKVSLWSDGLAKARFLYVPKGSAISFDDKTQKLMLPKGTIILKHFSDDSRPVETRVMVNGNDGNWMMATYQWNGKSEATRVDQPTVTPVGAFGDKRFRLPSPDECKQCHAPGNGVVLGFSPDQLNSPAAGTPQSALQELAATPGAIERLFAKGTFDLINQTAKRPDPTDPSLSISLRARAYIDLNCAPCHNPKIPQNFIDLSLATGLTTDYPASLESFERVVPGNPSKSSLWRKYSDPLYRMPPLSRYQDPLGAQLLHDWITEWPLPPAPSQISPDHQNTIPK